MKRCLLLLLVGCSSEPELSKVDPQLGSVRDLAARVEHDDVTLTWTNPGLILEAVRVARGVGSEPPTLEAEALDESLVELWLDRDVDCGGYVYAVWPKGLDGRYGSVSTVDVEVRAAPQVSVENLETGPLRWTLPADGFDHVLVERDGMPVYRGKETQFLDDTEVATFTVRLCNACRVCEPGVSIDVGPLPEVESAAFEGRNAAVAIGFVAPAEVEGVRISRDGVSICEDCTSPVIDTGLVNGQTYSYLVQTFVGTRVSEGVTGSATPEDTGLPEVFDAFFTGGDERVVIEWQAPPVEGVRIVRRADVPVLGPNDDLVCDPCTSPMIDEPLINDTTYHYRIYTYEDGNFSLGVPGSATPIQPLPDDPRRVEAIPRDEAVLLEWRAPTDIGFEAVRILRNTTPVTSQTDGDLVCDPCQTPHLDTGLTNGTTYHYGFYAYHADGRFSSGVQASATPATPPPLTPVAMTDISGDKPIAMEGNVAVMGLPSDADAGAGAGAILILDRTPPWSVVTKITHPESLAGTGFGADVDIASDSIVVGTRTGEAAYVFTRSGGQFTSSSYVKLVAPEETDDFGDHVAITADFAVVTEHDDDATLNDAGAIWIFERTPSGWSSSAPVKRVAADAGPGHELGRHGVDADGDDIVVSSIDDNGRAGALYVFHRSGGLWDAGTKLTAPTPTASEVFGWSMAVSGDTIAVGARQSQVMGQSMAGRVYVFSRSGGTWGYAQTLAASDFFAFAYFGVSVAVSADRILVGADRDGGAGDYGAAYVFEKAGGTFSQTAKLTQPTLTNNAYLGWDVAIDGTEILISNDASQPLFTHSL